MAQKDGPPSCSIAHGLEQGPLHLPGRVYVGFKITLLSTALRGSMRPSADSRVRHICWARYV